MEVTKSQERAVREWADERRGKVDGDALKGIVAVIDHVFPPRKDRIRLEEAQQIVDLAAMGLCKGTMVRGGCLGPGGPGPCVTCQMLIRIRQGLNTAAELNP